MPTKNVVIGQRSLTLDARPDRLDLRDRTFAPLLGSLPAAWPSDADVARLLPAYAAQGLVLDQGRTEPAPASAWPSSTTCCSCAMWARMPPRTGRSAPPCSTSWPACTTNGRARTTRARAAAGAQGLAAPRRVRQRCGPMP
jgi:hypothetical protein